VHHAPKRTFKDFKIDSFTTSPELSIDEQVVRLSRTLGDTLCAASPLDCGPYHTMRPILRYLGLLTSPTVHAEFYKEVSDTVKGSFPNIAVSGAADHSWTIPESPIHQHVTSAGDTSLFMTFVRPP